MGYLAPIAVIGEVSRPWYGGRLDPDWRPPDAEAKQAILTAAGLTGDWWTLTSA